MTYGQSGQYTGRANGNRGMRTLISFLIVVAIIALAVWQWSLFNNESRSTAEQDDVACVNVVRNVVSSEQIAAFGQTANWLFPGATLLAKGNDGSRIVPVTALPRAPVAFSIGEQISLNGPRGGVMNSPSLSAYRQSLDGLLSVGVTGVTAADVFWDSYGLSKRGQVGALLNLDVTLPLVASIENSFNWTDTTVTSRTLLQFTQVYYTVDMDKPATAADLFAAGVPEDAIKMLRDDLLYISSISYGRAVIIAYESRHADDEVKAALRTKFGWAFDGEAAESGLDAWSESALNETTFSGYIYGGSAPDAVKVVEGLQAVKNYIVNGGNYSEKSPGLPIAFQLSRARDNMLVESAGKLALQDRQCKKVRGTVRVTLKAIEVVSGEELVLCGLVTASGDGRTEKLFDQNCQQPNTITSGPGRAWESGDEEEFRLVTRPGELLKLRVMLKEYGRFSDTEIQDRTVPIRFEDGWDGTRRIKLGREDMQVNVVVELTALD